LSWPCSVLSAAVNVLNAERVPSSSPPANSLLGASGVEPESAPSPSRPASSLLGASGPESVPLGTNPPVGGRGDAALLGWSSMVAGARCAGYEGHRETKSYGRGGVNRLGTFDSNRRRVVLTLRRRLWRSTKNGAGTGKLDRGGNGSGGAGTGADATGRGDTPAARLSDKQAWRWFCVKDWISLEVSSFSLPSPLLPSSSESSLMFASLPLASPPSPLELRGRFRWGAHVCRRWLPFKAPQAPPPPPPS